MTKLSVIKSARDDHQLASSSDTPDLLLHFEGQNKSANGLGSKRTMQHRPTSELGSDAVPYLKTNTSNLGNNLNKNLISSARGLKRQSSESNMFAPSQGQLKAPRYKVENMMRSFRVALNGSRSKNDVTDFVDMSDTDQKQRITYLWGVLRENVK
jgi:hypothetical protein